MILYHVNCPKKPTEQAPELEWDGFYMAGISTFTCPLCDLQLAVEDDESS